MYIKDVLEFNNDFYYCYEDIEIEMKKTTSPLNVFLCIDDKDEIENGLKNGLLYMADVSDDNNHLFIILTDLVVSANRYKNIFSCIYDYFEVNKILNFPETDILINNKKFIKLGYALHSFIYDKLNFKSDHETVLVFREEK